MSEENKKFSFNHFLIKITSRKLLVWTAAFIILLIVLFNKLAFPYFLSAIIFCGVISLIYLIGKPAEKGIGEMIGNTKITAELKAGAQLNADAAKVVEAVKNIGG